MGWIVDSGNEASYAHEGFVVAVVRDGHGWRELGIKDVKPMTTGFRIQIGCECGWRSQRLAAPLSSRWFPASVVMAEADEDMARRVWREQHYDVIGDLGNAYGPVPSLHSVGSCICGAPTCPHCGETPMEGDRHYRISR